MSFRPAAAALVLVAAPLAAADPFDFKDGDRVVLIGSTLIEREQKSGYWELALTLKNKDKNVTFRNLGWSGDTVHAEARGRFDYADAAKCLDQLVSLTTELKPTVIVLCYGQNEAFDGEAGVNKFTKGLERLIDALAPTNARVVLMSPTPFGVRRHNYMELFDYRDAMAGVAERRGLNFVDLLKRVDDNPLLDKLYEPSALTDNGMHLTESGYAATAHYLLAAGAGPTEELPKALPLPEAQERLRRKIVEKNRLFFHRWRPQNETYLFGFRKHEQGVNAAEVAAFDPLVAAAEAEIAKLK